MSRPTSKIQFLVVDQEGLAPYQEGLHKLEQSIHYPVDNGADSFFIDHGAAYHAFFTHMGKALFLVALADGEVIGSLAGVWREAAFGETTQTGLYFCDLKLSKAWRGRGLARRIFWYLLRLLPIRRDFWGWRFLYFAAMRGENRDVSHSFRGWHLGKIVRPVSQQALFFVPADALAALPEGGPKAPGGRCLDFSMGHDQLLEHTRGRKDLRLQSTGEPWPLIHLPQSPAEWTAGQGSHLRECGRQIASQYPGSIACFGLDSRLQEQIQWLKQHDIQQGAQCVVYGFSVPGLAPRMRRFDWVHLSTSEI